MGVWDGIRNIVTGSNAGELSPERSVVRASSDFSDFLDKTIQQGGPIAQHAMVAKDFIERTGNDSSLYSPLTSMVSRASASGGLVGINDYGIKGRRQYAAERRRLLDLYSLALNNGDLRTATIHLRNEIFRRGLEWEPAFEFKCRECDTEYTSREAKKLKYRCTCAEEDEGKGAGPRLSAPDPKEIKQFDKFLDHANYFGQSFEAILRMCEDDLNTVDDAFIYFRKEYELSDLEVEQARQDPFGEKFQPDSRILQIFRLDPTLIEFDMDDRGVPGQGHHLCVFHRDVILDVPFDEGWDKDWRGRCPECGLRTYPIYYKYSEQQASAYGPGRSKVLYLLEDEVIHWSRYSPTETYGFPPVLSIYEKVMTLIGMDRYLYDYFYERKVPQGVVTVVTDDVTAFNSTKADVEARMQQDPHYIPWVAIASKSGQGKMEFVRFAYSLDELDYLPVRDEIRERIAGIYGVSQIWMQSTEGIGGLNNESQQLTVMSRVVEGAQRSYHTDVFPKFQRALDIHDWNLRIRTPEETNELIVIQILQAKASVAATMAGMGFGVEYDSEAEEFSYYGKVLSMEEQQKQQMETASPFGAGGFGGGGGGGGGGGQQPAGFQQGQSPRNPAAQQGLEAEPPIPPPNPDPYGR